MRQDEYQFWSTSSPITRLVYCEQFQYVNNAIAREEELKKWTRAQKIAPIEAANPTWEELLPDDPESAFFTQIPFGNDKRFPIPNDAIPAT